MIVGCNIDLLGGLRVSSGNRVVTRFATHKTASLLAYLACFPQRLHRRDALLLELWPEDELDSARLKLRKALTALRHLLEPPGVPAGMFIQADRSTVRLNPTVIRTDVAAFDAYLRVAAAAPMPAERARCLMEAVALYRGELLPGYFELWIDPERRRLEEACLQALDELVHYHEEAGDWLQVIEWARRAVNLDPLDEGRQERLIRLLLAAGHTQAAYAQYRELERLLREDLDARPAEALQALIAGHAGQSHRRSATATRRTRETPSPPVAAPNAPSHVVPERLPLTRFFGRVQQMTAAKNGSQRLCFNSHPPLRTGATARAARPARSETPPRRGGG